MAVTQNTSINLVVDQGTDFSKNLTVTTDGSTAYDISGLTIQAQMRKGYSSTTRTATFTCTIVSGTAGTYKLALTDTITAATDAGRYVYDVELILADSTIEKVHSGIITVNPEVTKF